MRISVLCSLIFLFAGCNQEFRTSLCSSYLENIPESFVGTYKINIQQFGSSDFQSSGGQEAYMYLTKLAVLTSTLPQISSTDISKTNFCEYGNDILIENVNSAGFYTYSLIKNTNDGLYITPLVLKPSTNLRLVSIPNVKVWENGAWASGMTINFDSNKLVDNAQVAPGDIFPYLTTSSFSIFYERVKVKSLSNISWKLIKRFQ